MQRSMVLGLVVIAVAGIASIVYVESTGGFAFLKPDPFPIMSSGIHQSGVPLLGPAPKISMSGLPNIGETAIVEMTFTNTYSFNITDADYSDPYSDTYSLGWTVSDGFEIVDFGGVQYEANPLAGTSDSFTEYIIFTPLDVGESKTYRIEVRAVNEGDAFIVGSGYFYVADRIRLYLDDEETLLLRDHKERYPELYERPERAAGERSSASDTVNTVPPITPEDMRAQEQNATFMNFTDELFASLAIEFIREHDPSTEWILGNILPPRGVFNMTYGEQVLIAAGYTRDEIDSIVSENMSAQSFEPRAAPPISPGSIGVTGQITNQEILYGHGYTTEVNSVQLCVFDENLRTGAMIRILCSTVSATGGISEVENVLLPYTL